MDDNEAETKPMTRRPRILMIKPNSNEAVREGLRQAVQPLNYAEGLEIILRRDRPNAGGGRHGDRHGRGALTLRYSGRALRI